MTSLHPCVCKFACLFVCLDPPLTVNHFQLLFYAFCISVKFKLGPTYNQWLER